MVELKIKPADDDAATRIDAGMPNYVGTEADLLAALAVGDADIEAGDMLSFEEVAAELRRNYGKD